jgi:hypothetical protein
MSTLVRNSFTEVLELLETDVGVEALRANTAPLQVGSGVAWRTALQLRHIRSMLGHQPPLSRAAAPGLQTAKAGL